MKTLLCPSCSARLSISATSCEFCGSLIELKHEKETRNHNCSIGNNLEREFELEISIDSITKAIDLFLILFKQKYLLKNINSTIHVYRLSDINDDNLFYQIQLFTKDYKVKELSFDDTPYHNYVFKTKIKIVIVSDRDHSNNHSSLEKFTNDFTKSIELIEYSKTLRTKYLFTNDDVSEALFELNNHFINEYSHKTWTNYLANNFKYKKYFDKYDEKVQHQNKMTEERRRASSNKIKDIDLSKDIRFKHILNLVIPPSIPFFTNYFSIEFPYHEYLFIVSMIFIPFYCLYLDDSYDAKYDPLLRLIFYCQIVIGSIALLFKFI
jgi:hypothetical protein